MTLTMKKSGTGMDSEESDSSGSTYNPVDIDKESNVQWNENLHDTETLPCASDDNHDNHDYHDEGTGVNIFNFLDELPEIDSSDSEDEKTTLAEDMIGWINEHKVKLSAGDALLKILRRHGHEELPSCARTLLQSDRKVNIANKSNMAYFNMGLEQSLLNNFEKYPENVKQSTETIEIALNVDGLPLFRSSSTCVWPVLCCIMIKPFTVFPAALTLGTSKPSNLDFLLDTISELHRMIQDGFQYQERNLNVLLKCIVCDAPARALVRLTKQYSGYYGCERCTQKGAWYGRVTYPDVDNIVSRTDESFRNQTQEGHHHGITPMTMLPVDMVKTFPLDYMHQACLGVMRRLLFLWTKGPRTVKLSANQIQIVSQKLLELKHCIPKLFARKPRRLEEVDRWKATEHRQFMLYTGKLVLQDLLRPDLYQHFMTFSIAMAILVSQKLVKTHLAYARGLLVYFVKRGRELYGNEFLVYNVHAMLHIADDAEEFGCLDSCSGFPFENYLGRLKKLVRSRNKALEQLVKRIHEQERSPCNPRVSVNDQVRLERPNNAFVSDSRKCCEALACTNEKDDQGNQQFLCRIYHQCGPLFGEPCDSRIIGAYTVHPNDCSVKVLSSVSLETPAIMIENWDNGNTVFLAVLHDASQL